MMLVFMESRIVFLFATAGARPSPEIAFALTDTRPVNLENSFTVFFTLLHPRARHGGSRR
jgi:hypothetical protein